LLEDETIVSVFILAPLKVFVVLLPCMKNTEEKNKGASASSLSVAALPFASMLERAQSLFDIGQQHYTQNEFELAAQHLSQALSLIQNSRQGTEPNVLALTAKSLKSLGTVHYILGNFSAALEFLMRADSLQRVHFANAERANPT
jgi:tetratricopeptide (TPR) repeat protein